MHGGSREGSWGSSEHHTLVLQLRGALLEEERHESISPTVKALRGEIWTRLIGPPMCFRGSDLVRVFLPY